MSQKIANTGDGIVALIFDAVLSKQLYPGIKLTESMFQSQFGFSRHAIRKAFDRLIHDGILSYRKNYGVTVIYPDENRAREIFQARKVIEGGIVKILAEKSARGDVDVKAIEQLIAVEQRLHEAGQQNDSTRASCEFHTSLGAMCGNAYLVDALLPLIPLSMLVAAVYRGNDSSFCSYKEHEKLADAICSGQAAKAIKAMEQHLDCCFDVLDFDSADNSCSFSIHPRRPKSPLIFKYAEVRR